MVLGGGRHLTCRQTGALAPSSADGWADGVRNGVSQRRVEGQEADGVEGSEGTRVLVSNWAVSSVWGTGGSQAFFVWQLKLFPREDLGKGPVQNGTHLEYSQQQGRASGNPSWRPISGKMHPPDTLGGLEASVTPGGWPPSPPGTVLKGSGFGNLSAQITQTPQTLDPGILSGPVLFLR